MTTCAKPTLSPDLISYRTEKANRRHIKVTTPREVAECSDVTPPAERFSFTVALTRDRTLRKDQASGVIAEDFLLELGSLCGKARPGFRRKRHRLPTHLAMIAANDVIEFIRPYRAICRRQRRVF